MADRRLGLGPQEKGPNEKPRGKTLRVAVALFLLLNAGATAWLVLRPKTDTGPKIVDAASSQTEVEVATAPETTQQVAERSFPPLGLKDASEMAPTPEPEALQPGLADGLASRQKSAGQARATALSPAPDPALVEESAAGKLPIIAADGREPWQVYAQPFQAISQNPRVAVIISDIGLNPRSSNRALAELPPEIVLAIAPYAKNAAGWLSDARAAGHEALLQLPMEPLDYPASDPGPKALLTSLSATDNLQRLDWILTRGAGYTGLLGAMGSRFTTSTEDLNPILGALKRRGLMFVDSRSSSQSVAEAVAQGLGLTFAANDRFIDNDPSAAAIDARLGELERLALAKGSAVGVGLPYPITIERINRWATGLGPRGIVLAPVSAVIGFRSALRPAAGQP
jgi:polysaccharide deacetylase 2 family uncharacterized protein YibQ